MAALAPAWAAQAQAPGTLVALGKVEYSSVKALLWQLHSSRLGQSKAYQTSSFKQYGPQVLCQKMVWAHLGKQVPSRGVQYASVDSHGHPRVYSGRVFLPSRVRDSAPTRVPLVIYQHATEIRRQDVPYFLKGDETPLGALGAELGQFAVAMPDGDGMGVDPSPEPHAYCHAATGAQCVIDMLRAVQGGVGGQRLFDDVNYSWDGRIFLMGYSEGGYMTMAAVKELACNPAYRAIQVTGAACMAGPFSISKSIGGMLRDAAACTCPYIPPYFLSAWASLYPEVVDLKAGLNPLLLGGAPAKAGNPDQGTIVNWLDGRLAGDQITPLVQSRLTGHPGQTVSARALANPEWIRTHLDNPESRLNQLLKANDLAGGWVPPMPLLLVHDPGDELVPFANSQEMIDSWKRQGADPLGIIPLVMDGHGAGHVAGGVQGVLTAFVWFLAGMPRSLMSLSSEAITARIAVNAAAQQAGTEPLRLLSCK